jgi:sec-independent protein translocase protein TatC
MFSFFSRVVPVGVAQTPDIGQYLSFVLGIFLAFGVAFEVPIATVMLIWSGLVSMKTLQSGRRYAFLAAFIIAAILTPPDVLSQTLLALPMYLLYEGGMIMAKIMLPEKTKS